MSIQFCIKSLFIFSGYLSHSLPRGGGCPQSPPGGYAGRLMMERTRAALRLILIILCVNLDRVTAYHESHHRATGQPQSMRGKTNTTTQRKPPRWAAEGTAKPRAIDPGRLVYLFCFNNSDMSTSGKIKIHIIMNICRPPLLCDCETLVAGFCGVCGCYVWVVCL